MRDLAALQAGRRFSLFGEVGRPLTMPQLRRRLGVFVSVFVSFVVVRPGSVSAADSLVEHQADVDARS